MSPAASAAVERTGKRAVRGASFGLCGNFRLRRRQFAVGLTLAVLVLGLCRQAQASFWEGGDWAGRDFTPANGDVLSGTFTNIGRFLINAGDTVIAGSGSVSLMTHDSVIDGVLYGGAALAPRLELIAQTAITVNGALDQWSYISLASGGNVTLHGSASISTLSPGFVGLASAPVSHAIASGAGTLTNSSGSITIYASSVSGTTTNMAAGSIALAGGDIVLYDRLASGAVLIAPSGTLVLNPPSIIPGELMVTAAPLPPALLLFAPGLAGILYARRRSPR